MSDSPSPDWLAPLMASAATVLVGFLGWLGVRDKAHAEAPNPQEVLNDGFQTLLDQMRRELVAASRERNHLNAVLEEERRAWRQEREAWRQEREAFLAKITKLQSVAEGFETLLRRNGVDLSEEDTAVLRQGPITSLNGD